jgi:hypothetical protein
MGPQLTGAYKPKTFSTEMNTALSGQFNELPRFYQDPLYMVLGNSINPIIFRVMFF